jgi:glycosyltransferase involved in cell wall biosynthesis
VPAGAESPVRRKVVIATGDALTARMAGPAIRAFNIAAVLAAEHDVRLLTTSTCDLADARFDIVAAASTDVRAAEQWCDVLVVQGLFMDAHPFLRRSTKVLVVDLYDPFHLEQLEQARDKDDHARVDVVAGTNALLNEQLARGDFFVCASEKQRDFWLGALAALGRVNPVTYDADETFRSLIGVAPFGVPEVPPVATNPALRGVLPGIAADDEVVIWGGGIYNWFDPLTLIRAVDAVRRNHPRLRLVFMGMRHPNPEVPRMGMAVAARELADELGITGCHVFFNEAWVPYDERQNYLLEADVAVSTHLDHLEAAFSFRTRVLDYIWAGVPIVATAGDAMADLIEERQLGLTVPPADVQQLADAITRLLDDADLRSAARQHAAAVRAQLAWPVALAPLVEFCRSPRRAPDLVDHRTASRLDRAARLAARDRRGPAHDLRSVARQLRQGRWSDVARGVARRLGLRRS